MRMATASITPSGKVIPINRARRLPVGFAGLGLSCPGDLGCPGYGGDPVDYGSADTSGAGSGGSVDWTSWLQSLTAGAFDIAKLQTVQPGTVLTPGGGISMQQTGYPIATSGSVAGISTTSIMLVAGIGLIAILALGRKR